MSKIRYQSPNTKKVLNCFMIIGIHPNCSLRVVDLLEFLVKIGSFFAWCDVFFARKATISFPLYATLIYMPMWAIFRPGSQCKFCKNPKRKRRIYEKKSALMLLFYQPATMAARLLHVKSENNYTLSLFFFRTCFWGCISVKFMPCSLRGL